jgi:hypothetical protein
LVFCGGDAVHLKLVDAFFGCAAVELEGTPGDLEVHLWVLGHRYAEDCERGNRVRKLDGEATRDDVTPYPQIPHNETVEKSMRALGVGQDFWNPSSRVYRI